jgi:hypothetical protein
MTAERRIRDRQIQQNEYGKPELTRSTIVMERGNPVCVGRGHRASLGKLVGLRARTETDALMRLKPKVANPVPSVDRGTDLSQP